ncbi:MAG: hypothetical protein KDA25_00560, partial [Phycisphaerales bacterium]|nr:hypothetical protein [Phycisphaerales bacterium]
MTPTTDGPYFLTPRVLDQQAFDELGGTLRTLIDDAGRAGLDLREIVRQAGVTDAAAAKASARLLERLNLAAGMLKAFQTQIDQAARIG